MDKRQKLKEKTEGLRRKMDKLIEMGASTQDILAVSIELDECFTEYLALEKEERDNNRQ